MNLDYPSISSLGTGLALDQTSQLLYIADTWSRFREFGVWLRASGFRDFGVWLRVSGFRVSGFQGLGFRLDRGFKVCDLGFSMVDWSFGGFWHCACGLQGCAWRAASLAARRPRRTQSICEPTVDRSLASP